MKISSLFRVAALLFVVGLAGCQTTKPIAMSVTATPTVPGTQNGDVLAKQRAAGQDIPELRGQEIVTVRTYEYHRESKNQVASKKEIEGISCEITSDGYKASLKTPAEVRVPDYGYASRPITASCKAPDYRDGHASVTAFSKTSQDRLSSASGGGLLGVVAVALIDAATDHKKHDYAYPTLSVTMNRIGCEKSVVGCR
ncbi:hypothetical protein [Pseudovibrio sp. SPO723]|uniref:hypothetical protein n=1 Tax=Nesiotobacter zosterae TaxID=392721 RepID=UPI0029C42A79|nr:hypothetical protein [Pseudovibrio sp. SPO723]MDX5594261.1 hypothetical protein [Pseudovibrio sp. SPO723]